MHNFENLELTINIMKGIYEFLGMWPRLVL